LGCGTGSGSIIDAVCQIRKSHPIDVKDNPIFLYCLLNSELPGGSTVDVGYFYQNQFAILSELNALIPKLLMQFPQSHVILGKVKLAVSGRELHLKLNK
jgi:hypothetical protein